MTELTMFSYEGAELRTLTIGGEPWFVAPDACRMLDLSDTSSALKMVDDEDKRSLRRSDTPQFFGAVAPQVQMLTVSQHQGGDRSIGRGVALPVQPRDIRLVPDLVGRPVDHDVHRASPHSGHSAAPVLAPEAGGPAKNWPAPGDLSSHEGTEA